MLVVSPNQLSFNWPVAIQDLLCNTTLQEISFKSCLSIAKVNAIVFLSDAITKVLSGWFLASVLVIQVLCIPLLLVHLKCTKGKLQCKSQHLCPDNYALNQSSSIGHAIKF